MALEEVTIIRVETGEAVRNIGDLKENIKKYKEALDDLDIGTEDYNNTLSALQVNQAALKNAMHATTDAENEQTISMEEVAKAAYGAGTSYNALVKRMAELDQQFRATEDATKRANLGAEIKLINNQLKELDEARGKFGRNVGNYKSALDGLASGFKATAGSAASVIQPLGNMTTGLKALSATPAIAALGLLANALSKVVSGLQSSEANTNSWRYALAAFQPIADAATRTIQAIGRAIADSANWIVDLLEKWGWLTDEMRQRRDEEGFSQMVTEQSRYLLKGTAQLEADIAELREKASDKEKYSAEQRLKFLKEIEVNENRVASNRRKLAQWRLEELQNEASHSENNKEVNDRLNQAEIDLIRVETEAAAQKRRLNREIAAVNRELNRQVKATGDVEEATRKELEPIEEITSTLSARAETMEAVQTSMDESLLKHIDKRMAANREEYEQEQALQKARVEAAFVYANALADVLGSVADVYEANGEKDEAATKKAKQLRTASAIISTISGAISAYMNTIESIKFPAVAIPLAIANAATVLAAGYAQIKQINAVKVGDSGGGNTAAAVAAPVFSPAVQQVRNVTGASEEERLYQSQRVYLVYSDIEVAQNGQRVKVAESAF